MTASANVLSGQGRPKTANTPEFVISLDFELLWGVRDHADRASYGANVLGARLAIPRILDLFARHQIAATWATVGFVMCATRDEMMDALPPPDLRPRYADPRLSSYAYLGEVGRNEAQDPHYFGASLVARIMDTPGQEVGTHTLSHFYCQEPGASEDAFAADLAAAVAIAARQGVTLRSIVFPRNQYTPAHVAACAGVGITTFRGNPTGWAYRATGAAGQTPARRALRLLDAHSGVLGAHGYSLPPRQTPRNVPASQFLRPNAGRFARVHPLHRRAIMAGMARAAQAGQGYHLWWHQQNFWPGHRRKPRRPRADHRAFHHVARQVRDAEPVDGGDSVMTAAAPKITVEPLAPDVMAYYQKSGLTRADGDGAALRWSFAGNDMPFCVARVHGDVAGLSAYIGHRMKLGGHVGTAMQAVDSYVSETMRGCGMFPALAQTYEHHAARRGTDIVWGFPNPKAAPIWFDKLGWTSNGQVPFLVKPLRAGFFLRKLLLPFDVALARGRDQQIERLTAIGPWADALWGRCAADVGVATVRDRAYLDHRLMRGPYADLYHVVADEDETEAIVATRVADKHGGRIAYVMEAMGGAGLHDMLRSEMARLRDSGVEVALAWAYPWSPNYAAFRRAGFFPLPERLRPIRIWFGAKALSRAGALALDPKAWYLSYLDSDTV